MFRKHRSLLWRDKIDIDTSLYNSVPISLSARNFQLTAVSIAEQRSRD